MEVGRSQQQQIDDFADIKRVVGDTLRFKRKLAIGEDAYTSMRVGKSLAQLWDVGGVAATGGSVAASATVAGTFFTAGGWMASLGFGAAAVTPVGWVIGAALATGGAYYGVTRLFKSYQGSRVDVIPKFINTPIDLLGASLMDFLGALSLKIAQMDGAITAQERVAIQDYFVEEWGFDRRYSETALALIEENIDKTSLKKMSEAFSDFARNNPDCNFEAMRSELARFLREVALADGVLDEREEFAIEKINKILGDANSLTADALGWAGWLLGKAKGKTGV